MKVSQKHMCDYLEAPLNEQSSHYIKIRDSNNFTIICYQQG